MASIPLNPLSPIVAGLRAIYGVAGSINDFIDGHIDDLKRSDNGTISATGKVLEGAKFGFGIGYITPIALTVAGHLIMGTNVLMIGGKAAMMALNPVATTCAAIGAIYFGWKALSNEEREEILKKISEACSVGIELIRSMISYVTTNLKELLSAENLAELKKFVKDGLEAIGRTVSSLTKSLADAFSDAATSVKEGFEKVREGVASAADDVASTVKERFEKKDS